MLVHLIGCRSNHDAEGETVFAYSVMHGLAPEYLAELLDRHHLRRVLRSAQWRIVGSRGPGARNSVGPSAMGETQRLPAGALEAPWSQTHFGNNMKIG